MKQNIRSIFAVAVLILLVVSMLPAKAAPQPTQDLYVYDEDGIFSQEVASGIIASSQALCERTGAQIAVAVVHSLNGQPIRDVSLDMLRSWGLGDREKNNGALILLAIEDRQSAIEVGYGLEGCLPDGKTGRIQDEVMLPHFREGGFETGLIFGYQEIYQAVCEEYGIEPSEISYFQTVMPAPAVPQLHNDTENSDGSHSLEPWQQAALIIGAVILLAIDWMFLGGTITRHLFMLLVLFGRGSGRNGRGGGFSGFSGGGGSGGGGGSSRGF